MNKLILVLSAVVPLLSGCNNSPNPPPPQPSPKITACPSDTEEEGAYSPIDQMDLLAKVKAGKNQEAFLEAFEQGDTIFATKFILEQGGGANIGGTEKSHYTRIPRADLKGTGEWGDPNRKVRRPTGPNAQACVSCHSQPSEDGAGPTSANVHRDPQFSANPELMIQRNTPHLFGSGAPQRLAEEMTNELHEIRDDAGKKSCATNINVQKELTTKGVNFGFITMTCASGTPVVDAANSKLDGIDADLVIRPFEWKKIVGFLRDFVRTAGNNEIGMQGVELVGKGIDEDSDKKSDELSVGDLTSSAIYMAAQPRPTTKVELDDLGILTGDQRLKTAERQQIKHGDQLFQQAGCAACHKPELTLNNSVFQEPSASEDYRDKKADFNQPGKVQVDLEAEGVRPEHPVKFDLAHDQPQNQLCIGKKQINLGAFETKGGKTIVRLYGDLKRHFMGDELAEPIDESVAEDTGGSHNMSLNVYNAENAVAGLESYAVAPSDKGKSTFGTKELWGVACTGPWLHNGRATTLTEAILLHGGEAADSRDRFKALSDKDQQDVIAFLGNQVIYLNTAAAGETPDGLSSECEVTK